MANKERGDPDAGTEITVRMHDDTDESVITVPMTFTINHIIELGATQLGGGVDVSNITITYNVIALSLWFGLCWGLFRVFAALSVCFMFLASPLWGQASPPFGVEAVFRF